MGSDSLVADGERGRWAGAHFHFRFLLTILLPLLRIQILASRS